MESRVLGYKAAEWQTGKEEDQDMDQHRKTAERSKNTRTSDTASFSPKKKASLQKSSRSRKKLQPGVDSRLQESSSFRNTSLSAKEIWKGGNLLYPLPAIMVSCQSPGEKPNIITLAWAGTVCSDPPMVSVSIRPERYSYAIIRETGEFVINLTTEELIYAADFCGVRSGRDLDKFDQMHLTAQPSSALNCPLIAESPVNLECAVKQVLELGSHHMFVAEIKAVDIASGLLDEKGKLDLGKAKLAAYSHGVYYSLGKQLGTFGYSVRKK